MVFHTQQEIRQALNQSNLNNPTIGLVPTMGALHSGHLSLVEKSLVENQQTIVSVFVNPTQFDNANDLKKYPRTLAKDVALLKTLSSNIWVYAPEASDLYGSSLVSKRYHFGPIEKSMEGAFRNGHFDGVGTVLNLLFRALNPTQAYFGEKDFQQLQIVKKLVQIEALPVNIVGCPIVREENGLAKSSRNQRLSEQQKDEAALIHKTLLETKARFNQYSIAKLKEYVVAQFAKNPHLELEYIEIAAEKNLQPAFRKRNNNKYRAFIAAYAGPIRLIDNMALNS